MFQDEAGFGRINKPKYCWCEKGIRPSVPCLHLGSGILLPFAEFQSFAWALPPLRGTLFFHPSQQLVLWDNHAFADLDGGKTLGVHQRVCSGSGNPQNLRHILGAEGDNTTKA